MKSCVETRMDTRFCLLLDSVVTKILSQCRNMNCSKYEWLRLLFGDNVSL